MPLPYSELVMEHFRNPRNVGRIDDPDAKSIEGSPACGDMVAVYLKVDAETQRIDGIQVRVLRLRLEHRHGFHHHRACQGKTLDEAKAFLAAGFGALAACAIKTHCSCCVGRAAGGHPEL